jgi:hypothetical protein
MSNARISRPTGNFVGEYKSFKILKSSDYRVTFESTHKSTRTAEMTSRLRASSTDSTIVAIPTIFDQIRKYYESDCVFEAGVLTGLTALATDTTVDILELGGRPQDMLEDIKPTCQLLFDDEVDKHNFDFEAVFRAVTEAAECLDLKTIQNVDKAAAFRTLHDRMDDGLRHHTKSLKLSGFFFYGKVAFDTPRDGKIGFVRPRRVDCKNEVPENVLSWPTETVFDAGAWLGMEGDRMFFKSRTIGPHDLGIPTPSAATKDCPICGEHPDTNQQFLKLRACGHDFCVNCIMQWANEVPDPDEEDVKCPLCRSTVAPPTSEDAPNKFRLERGLPTEQCECGQCGTARIVRSTSWSSRPSSYSVFKDGWKANKVAMVVDKQKALHPDYF